MCRPFEITPIAAAQRRDPEGHDAARERFEKAAQWLGPTQLHHLLMRTQPLVEDFSLREHGPPKRSRFWPTGVRKTPR